MFHKFCTIFQNVDKNSKFSILAKIKTLESNEHSIYYYIISQLLFGGGGRKINQGGGERLLKVQPKVLDFFC